MAASTAYKTWFSKWKRDGEPQWPKHAIVVLVHWTDATYSEDDHGTLDAFLVGFLKGATKDQVVLAMESFTDGETRTHVTVPTGMVNVIATLGTLDLQE